MPEPTSALRLADAVGPTSPLPPAPWDEPLPLHAGDLARLRDALADPADRTRNLALTRLQAQGAELLVAAALDGLVERDADGHARWSAGLENGLACPPSLAGFAAVHARVGRRELGGLERLLRSERTHPAIRAALRRKTLGPGAARELRRIAVDDGQIAAWIAFAEAGDRDDLGRRLALALPGDRPDDVDPIRASQPVVDAGDGAPDGVALRVQQGLAPLDSYWWARAAQRAAIAERAGVLPARRALEVMVERLATVVQAGRGPATPADLAGWSPAGEFHLDPIRQVAWVQVPGYRLQVPMDAVPRPGPQGRVEVLSATRERVPHTAAAVLEAFPELADDRLPLPTADPPEHRRWLETGLLSYGVQRPGAEPAPAAPNAPGERDDPLNTAVAAERALGRVGGGPVPDVAALTPDEQRALLAAAARVWREAECREFEQADAARNDALDCALELWGVLDALGYQECERFTQDRIRLAQRLRERPALRAAFVAGALSYTHARIVASRPARHEATWTELARVVDSETLRLWAAATPRDAVPPTVPAGETPLRPPRPVSVQIRGRLTESGAEAFRSVLGALESAAGRPLDPGEWIPLVARWYLAVTEGNGRPTLIYQRSPETRGAERPRKLMAESLWHIGPAPGRPFRRLRAAFAFLPDLGDPAADATAAAKADPRAFRSPEPGERRVPPVLQDIVRWMDGEHCIVPGCTNVRGQYDHATPVADGGAADATVDHRLCGPCNRARWWGWLIMETGPYGTVRFTDRWGRPLGVPRVLYAAWDGPVRAWLEAWARHEWEASPEFFSQFWNLVYAASPELAEGEIAASQEPSAGGVPINSGAGRAPPAS